MDFTPGRPLPSKDGLTLLHSASSEETCSFLLSSGQRKSLLEARKAVVFAGFQLLKPHIYRPYIYTQNPFDTFF